ncbi:hypothetical protein P6U16_03150 [Rhizobium sp. 32-5/1]|uniref:hypothetical protein n=1 Tax=Rhizobium sp. 32-5/1 TaxID=3019602 RepID=UPI00240CE81A|nr:hypothetical protein [Rhizobium sp. 32-5/1]WEZ83796.1 hypothetical protein P6U16_03150 [Rhizobium sp. 32-5/1]
MGGTDDSGGTDTGGSPSTPSDPDLGGGTIDNGGTTDTGGSIGAGDPSPVTGGTDPSVDPEAGADPADEAVSPAAAARSRSESAKTRKAEHAAASAAAKALAYDKKLKHIILRHIREFQSSCRGIGGAAYSDCIGQGLQKVASKIPATETFSAMKRNLSKAGGKMRSIAKRYADKSAPRVKKNGQTFVVVKKEAIAIAAKQAQDVFAGLKRSSFDPLEARSIT